MDLAGALDLGARELVAAVGAGGKKTALSRLLEEGEARGKTVGYTTTTHTPPLDRLQTVILAPDELPGGLPREPVLGFAAERVVDPNRADAKVRGYEPAVVDGVDEAGRFDWLLVKADGARRREFKAPGPAEPQVPSRATVVLVLASVAAVGEPLTDAAVHRPERVAALTATDLGDEITPETVSRVLASPDGGLRDVPTDARAVPVINKADAADDRATARRILEQTIAGSSRVPRGLVTSFRADTLEIVGD